MAARRSGSARRRASSTLAGCAIALGVVVLLTLAFGVWLVLFRPQVRVAAGRPVSIEVPDGASTRLIASSLAGRGVVSNPAMFRLRTRLAGADGKLRPGFYDLRTGMAYTDVIARLEDGPPLDYVSVTVPEGFTIDQVAGRFASRAGVSRRELLALLRRGAPEFAGEHPYLADAYGGSLEGYLFPKTYRVAKGATARSVVTMMLEQFDREIATVNLTRAERDGLSLPEVVTIASMIERETKVARERRLVSSVVRNRLRRSMKLELDATVEYVLPGNRFRLTWDDVAIDSPYNTYRYAGLPAGPISNPGLESLKAAADPASTAYLYYVLTGKDGTHTFATNRRDFLAAKRTSKEVFGK